LPELISKVSANALSLLDGLLVAAVVAWFILFLRSLRNQAVLHVFALFLLLYLVSNVIGLEQLSLLLERLSTFAVVAISIIYSAELRASFLRLSKHSRLVRSFLPRSEGGATVHPETSSLEQVQIAALELTTKKSGAIIVFELNDSVDQFIISGTRLDALVSVRLLTSIFDSHNPLHDGAAVIQQDRISQAGCFLPISEQPRVPEHLGTRHRAALGLTERCDAVVLVVSEERGTVSVAHQGRLALDLSFEQFSEQLSALLLGSSNIATVTPRGVLGA
jgi:uncharacterized protein (TIGR00159 family)